MTADQRFTPVELVFMQVIWEIGEASAEAVRAALVTREIEWTAGGVRRILGILVRKGRLVRRKTGRRFVYCGAISLADARRELVRDLLRRAFGGSVAAMAAALLDGAALTPDEYHRITELVAERDPSVR